MYSVEIRHPAGRQVGPTQLGMQMQRCDLGAVKSSSKFTKAPPVSSALLARGVIVATVEEAAADASISRATAYRSPPTEHQVGVGPGVVTTAVTDVPLGVGVPAVVVGVGGGVVGDFVGASVGETVVGRAVGSFVGSRGAGVLVLVSITGVPPDGLVAGGGGRSHK